MMESEQAELERCQARVGTTLLGKWRIDALLGVGGMAAVYAATHKIGRRVAIKILHPQIAVSKELRARFEQEARAVSQLGHEGIVGVFDIDTTEDGSPFLVMDLLEGGESLGQRARHRPLTEDELLRWMRSVLEVLEVAHGAGIVHRDIKPDNLFVTRQGTIKVLDFGIARMAQGGSNVRTRTGAMLGTTPYMPPEQIAGGNVDGRVDVFAVGATMFRLLAGRHVHQGTTDAELLIKMGTQQAPPLRTVAPQVTPEVAAIVDRALAFDVGARFPTAQAMRAAIENVLANRPSPSGPHSMDPTVANVGYPPSSRAVGAPPTHRETGAIAEAATIVAPATAFVPTPQRRAWLLPAVIVGFLAVGVVGALVFLRGSSSSSSSSSRSDDDDRSESRPKSEASGPRASNVPVVVASGRAPQPTSAPTSSPSSEQPTKAGNPKWRLLNKKGGGSFCVDSGLKHADHVRTDADGTRYCTTKHDGRVEVEGLKPYDPYESEW
ncbi:MAG: serine/threonine-protein kinase [Polyangiaceae bacterium]